MSEPTEEKDEKTREEQFKAAVEFVLKRFANTFRNLAKAEQKEREANVFNQKKP